MNKYASPGTGRSVNFAQYLAELLVHRKARQQLISLPGLFWKDPDFILWTKELKSQIFGVNKLLKIYTDQVIFQTFLENDWVYSSHSPKFQSLIRENSRKKFSDSKIDIIEEVNSVPKKLEKKSKKDMLSD